MTRAEAVDLISVGPAKAAELKEFARTEPNFAETVRVALRFRARVLMRFERLMDAGGP
jgi:hypothetical protein